MIKHTGIETIVIDEKVSFAADYFSIVHNGARLICSFDGQFLMEDKPFDPPMRYSLNGVGVTTQDKIAILRPIYYSLLMEREGFPKTAK